MKNKPANRDESWLIQYGHVSLNIHTTSSGETYSTGYYMHPLGVVAIYREENYCRIDTSADGVQYMRTRNDNPTEKQISYFCRKLLLEIH